MRVAIAAALALSAFLLGAASAVLEHGHTLGGGILGMGAATAAFVAGVLVGADT